MGSAVSFGWPCDICGNDLAFSFIDGAHLCAECLNRMAGDVKLCEGEDEHGNA